ncbi:CYTH domain-containing protein [Billgrantia endophytica]|uniref:CYTH domain-containing protein n=1 Tax=Billgrantia endophytica TaxID=2033802 RepID=A0A2N7U6M9_9GAMM|nr:CYTH domain-containing protein [Halomonas endophytica]PMR76075.1 CYTH domain-containing protein [Halomonas endophytica]
MSQEIELKLALGNEGAESLCCHSRLSTLQAETQRLANTYFDTPQGDLEAARMALRLRCRNDRWIQTLKTSGKASGGMSHRGEWEWTVAGPELDREGLAALPPLAELGASVLDRLTPRFTTDFQRRLWLLDHAGATIEVALDQGEIRTAGHAVPIRELELELKRGNPDALWELAVGLAETIPLRPADASKAARGSALLAGHWTLPEGDTASERLHHAILALDALGDTGNDTWRMTARDAFRQLAENGETEAGALAAMLDEPDWLSIDFGRQALRLAHRLAP